MPEAGALDWQIAELVAETLWDGKFRLPQRPEVSSFKYAAESRSHTGRYSERPYRTGGRRTAYFSRRPTTDAQRR